MRMNSQILNLKKLLLMRIKNKKMMMTIRMRKKTTDFLIKSIIFARNFILYIVGLQFTPFLFIDCQEFSGIKILLILRASLYYSRMIFLLGIAGILVNYVIYKILI